MYGQALHWRYSSTYNSWRAMKSRCGVKPEYMNVSYPVSWEKFENFFRDMGERPKGTSLDRKDSSLDYSKENCQWATPLEQTLNRSCTILVEWEGKQRALAELALEKGLKVDTVFKRFTVYGWSLERALTQPRK